MEEKDLQKDFLSLTNKRWKFKDFDEREAENISQNFGFSYLLLYEKLIMPTWEPVLEQTLHRAFGCFAEVIGILRPCSYPRLHGP